MDKDRIMSYGVRLRKPSLYSRRRRKKLVQIFKLFLGHYDTSYDESFQLSKSSKTRGHSRKLQPVRANRSTRLNFFSVRVIQDWNPLPEVIVSSNSLNHFKTGMVKFVLESSFHCANSKSYSTF